MYMKFLEDILNRFQVTVRTQFCGSAKGNNSKSVKASVRDLALCTSANVH